MEFIQENYIYISILSIIIFGSLVIFSIFKDKFTDIPPYITNSKQKRMVNIETFDDKNDTMSGAFCKKYQPTPHLLKSHCKNLGTKGCHIPRCCVLVDGKECVPGDHHGPTFRTQHGKQVPVNFFSHQGKCTNVNGKCPN
tara:strand:+ start:1811 stop:2230 length:420 start_codon:yes stop_codon:yes gene_type:complete